MSTKLGKAAMRRCCATHSEMVEKTTLSDDFSAAIVQNDDTTTAEPTVQNGDVTALGLPICELAEEVKTS